MVESDCDSAPASCRFVVRPNRSLSWRGTLLFFAAAFLVSVTIATGFAVIGLWLIFPFAGLEMLALAAGLYVCACRGHECEVIDIDGDKVEVDRSRLARSLAPSAS